jgi:hypothetical protein
MSDMRHSAMPPKTDVTNLDDVVPSPAARWSDVLRPGVLGEIPDGAEIVETVCGRRYLLDPNTAGLQELPQAGVRWSDLKRYIAGTHSSLRSTGFQEKPDRIIEDARTRRGTHYWGA